MGRYYTDDDTYILGSAVAKRLSRLLTEASARIAELEGELRDAENAVDSAEKNQAIWCEIAEERLARAEKAEAERDELQNVIGEMHADHSENFAGKIVMDHAAFDELFGYRCRAEKAEAALAEGVEVVRPFAEIARLQSERADTEMFACHDVTMRDLRRASLWVEEVGKGNRSSVAQAAVDASSGVKSDGAEGH
jgi:hypothetical protein